MQDSAPSSTDSPPTSVRSSASEPLRPVRHVALFLLTALSVFGTVLANDRRAVAAFTEGAERSTWQGVLAALSEPAACGDALQFAASLLGILLAHEFGHYFAARFHRVPASLPFFLPLPMASPFGTLGAVIKMGGTIERRRALLDIGASGPLAGLLVALPLYAYGAAHSQPVRLTGEPGEGLLLGESLLLKSLDALFAPPLAAGEELMLSPVAYAAWAGMFVTMLNLLPVGQLDAGHVAYALFGKRQNGVARVVHRLLLLFFFAGVASGVVDSLRVGAGLAKLGEAIEGSLFWLGWFHVLTLLGALSQTAPPPEGVRELAPRQRLLLLAVLMGTATALHEQGPLAWCLWLLGLGSTLVYDRLFGALQPGLRLFDHPPCNAEPLGRTRTAIAVLTLLCFVLLFMPQPIALQ